jgi:hypothetical protein
MTEMTSLFESLVKQKERIESLQAEIDNTSLDDPNLLALLDELFLVLSHQQTRKFDSNMG